MKYDKPISKDSPVGMTKENKFKYLTGLKLQSTIVSIVQTQTKF
jgi:hypothetical protein